MPKRIYQLGPLGISRNTVIVVALLVLVPLAAAYAQWIFLGLPAVPTISPDDMKMQQNAGFPLWLCLCHYANLVLMILLIRSGLQILMDHPRLYWNVHCTPGTEWIRFTRTIVPCDRLYTAKDDARYLTPWIGLPGGRHTLGLARHWHFISALFWTLNGAIYIALLFASGHWSRLVPTTFDLLPQAWALFVHYATFHLPPEPNGYYQYNALQQLSYFGVTFILAPLSIFTGPAMSPALVNRFKWYRKLPGNRQMGRSIHFLLLCGYIAFLIPHISLVMITGFERNMNHIVLGSDGTAAVGMFIGISGIVILIAANVAANWISWLRPRWVQHAGDLIVNPVIRRLLSRHAPRAEYLSQDISPFFWPNGKLPTSPEWKTLAADSFRDYRLHIFGDIENPVELSLKQLHALGEKTQITLHHCIQGWSGIAAWGGIPMTDILKLVRPRPGVTAVIFYSFGEGGGPNEGGQYYESHTLDNMRHPQTMLAWSMNFHPLNDVHGAPLRLRVENQLGFKMVKWIHSIEFTTDLKHIYQGEGGYAEDHEFFDTMADI